MRHGLFLILSVLLFFSYSQAQDKLLFNSVTHDFGEIGQLELPFEHDFIFRNTSFNAITILSARTIHPNIKFIHTKSEVFTGEYGFVKVKLYTDSLVELLNEELYLTYKVGDDVKSEILYLRANVIEGGDQAREREFVDSRISTSVEVSAEDIENMEGFFGSDRLTQVESELKYLRKQIDIKSELIYQLSNDLQQKKLNESEHLQQLNELQKSLSSKAEINQQEVLAQVTDLTSKLEEIQKADESMRVAIEKQTALYETAKLEADSARNYAENLSEKLQKQFDAEAKAIEKANSLERSLREKELTEEQQKNQIDSLERMIALESNDQELKTKIASLQEALDWKRKEETLQKERELRQKERIAELNNQKVHFEHTSDSLSKHLVNQFNENTQLQNKLAETSSRVTLFETKIDSLGKIAAETRNSKRERELEIERLNAELIAINSNQQEIKAATKRKELEIKELITVKDKYQHISDSLSKFVTFKLEQNKSLEKKLSSSNYQLSEFALKVDSLKKVSKAADEIDIARKKEINRLNTALNSFQELEREQASKTKLQEEKLAELILEKRSIKNLSDSLSNHLEKQSSENQALLNQLSNTNSRVYKFEQKIDSLNRLANASIDSKLQREKEVDSLQIALSSLQLTDQNLKKTIASKESEIARILADKQSTEKNISVLEVAANRQLEEAHSLMHRVNALSKKESEARMIVLSLQEKLNTSIEREDSAKTAVLNLLESVDKKDDHLKELASNLKYKEMQLRTARTEEETLRKSLVTAETQNTDAQRKLDSLAINAETTQKKKALLESEISRLQNQIIASHNQAKESQLQAKILENKLNTATLSNKIVFEELKGEVSQIVSERDEFKEKYFEAVNQLQTTKAELEASQKSETNALAFASELGYKSPTSEPTKPAGVEYALVVISSNSKQAKNAALYQLGEISVEEVEGKFRYLVRDLPSIKSAEDLAKKAKAKGYPFAHIVAFKNGKQVSLKVAQETASR